MKYVKRQLELIRDLVDEMLEKTEERSWWSGRKEAGSWKKRKMSDEKSYRATSLVMAVLQCLLLLAIGISISLPLLILMAIGYRTLVIFILGVLVTIIVWHLYELNMKTEKERLG